MTMQMEAPSTQQALGAPSAEIGATPAAEIDGALDRAVSALGAAALALDALLPRLDDEERWKTVARVGDLGRAIDSLKVRIAADVVHRHDDLPKDERFTVACGYLKPLDMLATELGASHFAARRLLGAVAALRPRMGLTGAAVPARFPVLGAALDRGAVSLDQAVAVVEALGDAPDRANPEHVMAAEVALVESALGERGKHPADDLMHRQGMSPLLLAKVARVWRDAMDPDGLEPRYDEQLQQRTLTLRTRADGSVSGSFILPPDAGATLLAAFDPFTAPRKPAFRSDEEQAELERSIDDRTRGQKMADALVAMVSRAVEVKGIPRVGGEAPVLVLHLSEETFRRAVEGKPGCTATDLRSGERVPIWVAAAIMCDGFIQSTVTGAKGKPLYLGRKRRLFSRSQRRAIAARDKGCRAPGCTAPVSWTQTHHVTPWSEGGKTDIDNGILLCSHHHHEAHRGMLEIVMGPKGWVVRAKTKPPRRRRGWADDFNPSSLYLQPVG